MTNDKDKNEDTSNYYVRNKDLLEELYKWRDTNPDNPEERVISERLGEMMFMIAKRLTNHFNFSRYPEELKEDMVSLGCYKAITGLKNYNFEYKNPFAYLTQIFWNANVATCAKYYKHKNGMKKYTIDAAAEVGNSMVGSVKSVYLHQVQKSLQDFLDSLTDDDEEEKKEKDGKKSK